MSETGGHFGEALDAQGIVVVKEDDKERAIRDENRLCFLRLQPDSKEFLYCHGDLTFCCRDFMARGTDAHCQLKLQYADDQLGYMNVNLSSHRNAGTVARMAIGKWPKLPVSYDDLVQNIHMLQDMLRSQIGDLMGSAPSPEEVIYVMSKAEEEEALELLKSSQLLDKLDAIIDDVGIVKEEHNRMMVYLCYTSRLLIPPHRPINIMVKGESSTGKSFIARRVLDLFPKETYIELTDASPKSFQYYQNPEEMLHKIVYVQEMMGSTATDYAVRIMQSEDVMVTQTVEKDPQTGKHSTRRITVKGPTMFLMTTTQAQINPENETRVLFLYSDESREQTARILDQIASSQNSDKRLGEQYQQLWQNAQRMLKPQSVYMDHVLSLDVRSVLPVNKPRIRRDAGKFYSLIATLALLHQYQREHRIIDGVERIIATLDDVGHALTIGADCFASAIGEIAPKTQQILEYCRDELSKSISTTNDPLDDEETTTSFTWYDLVTGLGWAEKTIKKWGQRAIDMGILETVYSGGRGGRGRATRFRYNARMHHLVAFGLPNSLVTWMPASRIYRWGR